jgi:XTP/dITP diphosphohydrolase
MTKDGDSRNMIERTPPLSRPSRLIIATHNNGKLREFRDLLAPYADGITSAGELNLPEPEETGTTFAENALLKARAAASLSGSLALADDSGFCVTALDGRPGLYSARWAGPGKDFSVAMKRVRDELGDAADRSAHFICVLALAWPDGRTETVEGRIDGQFVWPPRGTKGHGYDPVFMPDGKSHTFAEMDENEKNAISHRGISVRKLIEGFFA